MCLGGRTACTSLNQLFLKENQYKTIAGSNASGAHIHKQVHMFVCISGVDALERVLKCVLVQMAGLPPTLLWSYGGQALLA